jgi:NAD(P)-dependent dehydrogenase (short-subunit alcohol dehydrogenase family)
MTTDATPNLAAILRLAPVVRGCLAEPTGDEDLPHAMPLLSCRAAARRGPGDTLALDELGPFDDLAAFRTRLVEALAARKTKPAQFTAKGLGGIVVDQPARADAPPMAGRVAVVTGAAGAIGYAVCLKLLENGCHLAATDLPGEKLDAFVADLAAAAPGRVIGVPMDVTSPGSTAAAFAKVVETWGGADIVVHNAGIALVAKIADLTLENFQRLERVNVDGTLVVLREAGELLARQGTGGDIVIMSTKNVPSPSAGFGAYSATKAACHQLGRIASLELAAIDVRVNMVAPDAVFAEGKYKSGLWQEVGADRMKARGLDEKGLHEYYRSRNLLKARVTGRHVANAVYYFVSRQSPTTGATIPVDGGLPDATPR